VSPRTVSDPLVREAPVVRADASIADAVRAVLDSRLPALLVVDERDRLRGIFGEREFMNALFPGYLQELRTAGFVPRALEDALEKRAGCRVEPVHRYMNTEHIDVGTDFSDAQVAEIFLHHRVLLVPVVDQRRVVGVITRSEFFRALAERFLATPPTGPK
jgi:predicted transcriptional regulator